MLPESTLSNKSLAIAWITWADTTGGGVPVHDVARAPACPGWILTQHRLDRRAFQHSGSAGLEQDGGRQDGTRCAPA